MDHSVYQSVNNKVTMEVVEGMQVSIYTIDSCEYIGYIFGKTSWASHRGRCKFCAERSKNSCK